MRKTYSFLARVQARIPAENETILSTHPGEVAFYEAVFPARLRFLVYRTIRRILSFYNICPAQISPNAWRCVVCVLVIWRFYRCHMSLNEFRCLYTLFKNPKPNSGWLYFKARSGKNMFKESPSNVKGWKNIFFFISEDDWEILPNTTSKEVPWVPRVWGSPGQYYFCDFFVVYLLVLNS